MKADGSGSAGGLLINIDIPDLATAIVFYRQAFGLRLTRRLGEGAAELAGWPVPVYLLENAGGTLGAGCEPRRYNRHWTPVHFDIIVDDLDAAVARAVAAGAILEGPVRTEAWGRIAGLADPYGHGCCLIAFSERGYDAIAEPPDRATVG